MNPTVFTKSLIKKQIIYLETATTPHQKMIIIIFKHCQNKFSKKLRHTLNSTSQIADTKKSWTKKSWIIVIQHRQI